MFYQCLFWTVVYALLSIFAVSENESSIAFLCAALSGIHAGLALMSRKAVK